MKAWARERKGSSDEITLTVGGVPVIGLPDGEEVIHVERDASRGSGGATTLESLVSYKEYLLRELHTTLGGGESRSDAGQIKDA